MDLRKKGKDTFLLFAFYCIALFILYFKYFLAGQIPMSGDAFLPFTEMYLPAQGIRAGELPLWNKFLSCGTPFVSAYTPTMLLGFLPIRVSAYILYIGFVALGATFAYKYFEKIGCGRTVSICISFCYLLSIHLGGGRKSHCLLIYTISLLPVILYLIEEYFSTRKLRWLLGSAVVMALQFVVGFTQQVIYTDLYIGIYLLSFGFHYKMKVSLMVKHGFIWLGTYFSLIFWKILAIAQQMWFYNAGGSENIDFSTFISYSIHPIKLIESIFPQVFGGNVGQAFGPFYSSEADIELFFGHFFVILVIFATFNLFKNFRIRFALATMFVTFAYAAMAHIPYLSQIVYRIPLLKGFRVPSRILFLFIFSVFTIVALTLSALKEKELWEQLKNIGVKGYGFCILFIIGIMAIWTIKFVVKDQEVISEGVRSSLVAFKSYLLKDFVYISLCCLLVFLLYRYREKLKKHVQPMLCCVVACLTICEVLPYTAVTEPISATEIEITDTTSQKLKTEIGDAKIWDALQGIDGVHTSIISQNRSITKEIPSLNSYIPMNNPILYKIMSGDATAPINHSGLLTGSLSADENLHRQNALLSMLGIEYIIDSSNLLAADSGISVVEPSSGEAIIEEDEISIPYSGEEFSVFSNTINLNPDTYYEISFDCISTEPNGFYVDFYGGEGYDFPAQQVEFQAGQGKTHFSAIINSGDVNQATSEVVYRVVSYSKNSLVLMNFKIDKKTEVRIDDVYQLWGEINGTSIYRNTRARDILYIPDETIKIDSIDDLYTNRFVYQVDRINYGTEFDDKHLNVDAVNISQIQFLYNDITAKVETPSDTFVNFSQCYYPGWKAYVDGVETKVYVVNGLIMGMQVPAGSHMIQFVYQPTILYIGIAISCIAVLILIGTFIVVLRIEKDKRIVTKI